MTDIVGRLQSYLESERDVMVLQHGQVIVQHGKRLACVDKEGVATACIQISQLSDGKRNKEVP